MFHYLLRAPVVLAGLGLSFGIHAASFAAEARVEPWDARAHVPAVVHRSAIANYRSAADVAVESWREANDRVTRIGGWRTYLREANAPDASAAPAAGPAAGAAGQGGHHGKH